MYAGDVRSIAAICDAMKQELRPRVPASWVIHSYDEIPEAHNDLPAIDITWDRGSDNRYAYQQGQRRSEIRILLEVRLEQRADLSMDMKLLTEGADTMREALWESRSLGKQVADLSWEYEIARFEEGGQSRIFHLGFLFTCTVTLL
jgi:hypothetical protein